MKKQIKDPYFEIFSRGGNVEKSISADPKANGETKKKLIQLAKDEADIKFDLELEINYDATVATPNFFDSYQAKKSELESLMQDWGSLTEIIEKHN